MCNQINFSAIVGIKILRDGDGDGKCQEEDGKWVPCPPGVANGSVVDRTGRAIGKLGQTIGHSTTKPTTTLNRDHDIGTTPHSPSLTPEGIKQAIAKRRAERAERARIIAEAANDLPDSNKDAARRFYMDDFSPPSDYMEDHPNWMDDWEENNPQPVKTPDMSASEHSDALDEWSGNREYAFQKYIEDLTTQNEENAIDAMGRVFSYKFKGKDGEQYYVVVVGGRVYDSGGIQIEGNVVQRNGGKTAGEYTRIFYPGDEGTVNHDFFFIDEQFQNAGIASAVNGRNEQLYKLMGFTNIETHGVSNKKMKGATHWPKNGFDWKDETNRNEFLSFLKRTVTLNEMSRQEYDYLHSLIDQAEKEDFNSPNRLTASDFLFWNQAENHFKKYEADFYYRRDI